MQHREAAIGVAHEVDLDAGSQPHAIEYPLGGEWQVGDVLAGPDAI